MINRMQPALMSIEDRKFPNYLEGGRFSGLRGLSEAELSYFRARVIDKRGNPLRGVKVEVRGGDVNADGATDGDGDVEIQISKPAGTRLIAFVHLPELASEIPPGYELPTVAFGGKKEIFQSSFSTESIVNLSEGILFGIAILTGVVGFSLYTKEEDTGMLALGVSSSILAGTTVSIISRHTR